MENQRILILGASGFLGQEVYNFYKNKNICFGTCFKQDNSELIKIDLTKLGELAKLLGKTNPDIVINCLNLGGFLDKEPDQTERVNYWVNEELARRFDKKIVFFSTDSVFDGEKGEYIETDLPNPINNYGRTKALGEKVLINSDKNLLVLRLGILYKNSNNGYMKFVIDNLKEGKEIEAWEDIVSCPTHIDDVLDCLDELLSNDARGIYHINGPEKMSRFEFASKIADAYGLDKSLIKHPLYSGEIKRPKDTSLKSIKLKKQLRKVDLTNS